MSAGVDRDDAWRREAVLGNYAERPFHAPPVQTRIWSYCDRLSYAPGEAAQVSVCTNAKAYDVEVVRDGAKPATVFTLFGTDLNEAIEIEGPAGTDLTGWSIVLYNGNGGVVYEPTQALTGTINSVSGAVTPTLTLMAPGEPGSLGFSRDLRVDTLAPVAPTLAVASPVCVASSRVTGSSSAMSLRIVG